MKENMENKFKLLISAIILSLSMSNVNADVFNIAKKNPLLSAVGLAGGALYVQTAMHKSRNLSYNLPKVEPYFKLNPQDFSPIAQYVLWALSNPANKKDYDRYKRLAEVMGLQGIPPYIAPQVNNSNVLTNPSQNPDPNDNILENPIQEQPFSNIIYTPQGEKIDTSTEFPIEGPQNWEDYLLLKSNSQQLADNMANGGMGIKPKGYAAHHAIPATEPGAQNARDILNKYGIDINDAVNGVYLPTPKDKTATQGIEHNGRHPLSYAERVNRLIIDADNIGGKQSVLNKLNDIKNNLKNAPRNTNWRNVL